MADRPVVDVDDRATWPARIAQYVDQWADVLRGTTDYACDLGIPLEESPDFCRLFDGVLLRAYHCTHLLNHEVSMVRERGVRPLTADLLNDRIAAAHAHGVISDDEREHYAQHHLLAKPSLWVQAKYRQNKVCLVISQQIFKGDVAGLKDLLDTWGGEGLVSALGWSSSQRDRLRGLGRPSIVVALLDIASEPERDFITPALGRTFVGSVLGLEMVGSEIHYRSAIPPEHIEDIWHPGDPGYDRHLGLPLM